MKLAYKKITTPVGVLKLVANPNALVAILWGNETRVKLPTMSQASDHRILQKTEKQLFEYFAGKRSSFELEMEPVGTEFQKKIWSRLRKIPFGKTISYKELAQAIGSPKAARAAGSATGKNPISIVVPCHRVIGANGNLIGFAGGLKAKTILLELEKRR